MQNPLLTTHIRLPGLVIDQKKIGKNKVDQLAQNERIVAVKVFPHTPGCFLLVDEYNRKMYLNLADLNKKNIKGARYVLRAKRLSTISDLDKMTDLAWEVHHRLSATQIPSEILATWIGIFSFVPENVSVGKLGLRQPQMGALHAIASHWSVTKECATVVMPTGTGKTEVMLSTIVAEACQKTLIIVPSAALRDQIFNKFTTLGRLSDIGVIPDNTIFPRVAKIQYGIKDIDEIKALLKNSNVLVATASVLNEFNEECLKEIVNECSHLFVDEAHHTPAPTWHHIKELFLGKPIIQFTATPFRRDGQRVEGIIIYDYPLGLAQDNGYFKEINLIKISEIDDEKSDKEIALKAVAVLKEDLEKRGLDHVLMARVKNISKAKLILEIYKDICPEYSPILIYSSLKTKEKTIALQKLQSRDSRVVVCVDMLGEGFDLPNLKIAAIHDIHKSLAITLQFVGRFTRISSDKVGNATVIVNTADVKVDKKLESLYSENPDWNKILQQQSESAIRKEKKLQEVILNFKGELSKQVSLWNLRPAFSTLIYKTHCQDWTPYNFEDVLPKTYQYWYAINNEEKILVAVISKQDEVTWGKYKGIKNLTFDLCVAYWDSTTNVLFIQCSDYNAFNCDALARRLCGDDTIISNGHKLFNIFSGINHPMVQNLGASKTGTISYTMYFGPEVNFGLSAIDRAESTPNNIFGWGYEEGERVTYGCSAKSGKVWSRGGGSVVDWKEWCETIESKIRNSEATEADIIKGFLRPQPMNGRYRSVAIGVEWGEGLIKIPEHSAYIYFDDVEYKIFEVSLEVIKHSDTGPISILLSTEYDQSEYEIVYTSQESGEGKCTYKLISGKPIFIKRHSGSLMPFVDYMVKDPIIIRYADGSFSYGNYHIATPSPESFFDKSNIEAISWDVDIHSESQGKEVKTNSIQYKIIESIKNDYDIIINDDGSGEAADIIALRKDTEESYSMHFIHCKFSKTDKPGADIGNMYELCGQAQKCISWKHQGIEALVDHIKRREEKWQVDGHTRFVKGDLAQLINLKKFSRYAKSNFAVTIVQPGLSKERISTNIIQLLGCTENYLIKTSNAPFRVICSE